MNLDVPYKRSFDSSTPIHPAGNTGKFSCNLKNIHPGRLLQCLVEVKYQDHLFSLLSIINKNIYYTSPT